MAAIFAAADVTGFAIAVTALVVGAIGIALLFAAGRAVRRGIAQFR